MNDETDKILIMPGRGHLTVLYVYFKDMYHDNAAYDSKIRLTILVVYN